MKMETSSSKMKKRTPIISILKCEKCGSEDISYYNDAEGLKSNHVTLTEWATGQFDCEKDYDYYESVRCESCGHAKLRRRKIQ